jgi:hypothetical protein
MVTTITDVKTPRPAGGAPAHRGVEACALSLAALFAGAAIYILVAEQPARLQLADGAMLRHWQAMIGPATAMQASLAVAAALAGFLSWRRTREPAWLIGMAAMLANLPVTLLLIAPVNAELMALSADITNGPARGLVEKWGQLHAIRAALGGLVTILFGWALSRRR